MEVDDRRFERSRTGRREHEHLVLGAVDRAQSLLGDGEDLREVGERWWITGRASACSTSGGTAVGPGVISCCGRDIV